MAETTLVEPVAVGRRARVFRRHRGLPRELVAELAGIGKKELAALESGTCHVTRRGVVENLANALGCPVTVLTGQPYLPTDRITAEALGTIPGIRIAILCTLPDGPAEPPRRPVTELVDWAHRAQEHLDQARYSRAGADLATLLGELHGHAAGPEDDTARVASAALVTACHVAATIAGTLGYHDLALATGRRGLDTAARLGDPASLGLARFGWAQRWLDVAALPQARRANALALSELDAADQAGTAADVGPTALLGMHRLLAATIAARAGLADAARNEVTLARALSERTGECGTAHLRFGPTTVALWSLTVEAYLGGGADAAEQAQPIDVDTVRSNAQKGCYHLDLALLLAQHGDRDDEAIQHLDLADQAAPVPTRTSPLVRELTEELTIRARRYRREVDSLLSRFGMGGAGSQVVNN